MFGLPKTKTTETPTRHRFSVRRISEVAQFAHVSRRTVAEWLANGCPGEPGDYRLDEIFLWVRQHIQPRNGTQPHQADSTTNGALKELERRHLAADVAVRELKLSRLRGELIAVATVEAWFMQACARIVSRLEAIADECASSLPPESQDVTEDIRFKVRAALRELSQEHFLEELMR